MGQLGTVIEGDGFQFPLSALIKIFPKDRSFLHRKSRFSENTIFSISSHVNKCSIPFDGDL